MKPFEPPPEIEIEPIAFHSESPGRSGLSSVVKWCAGCGAVLFFLCLAGAAWFVFTARQVVIRIQPEPDQISLDGGIFSPKLGDPYLLRPGAYALRAQKEGYHPLDTKIRVTDHKSQTLNFSMEKLPGTVSLAAHQADRPDVIIDGAAVFIDQEEIGKTPVKSATVKAGRRRLAIEAENYQKLETQLVVEGMGRSQSIAFALLPAWADVTIRSIPEGADVLIDGSRRGKTPLALKLPGGTYALELNAGKYKSYTTQLTVEANRPKRLEPVRLEPRDGILVLNTQPGGASVTIGDKYIGRTPAEIPLKPNVVHRIRISKAGYQRATQQIKVAVAEKRKLTVSLTPEIGVVHLTVRPSDATLFVDGKRYGGTPEKLELTAVAHTVEARKAGYEPFTTQIIPRPGFPQQLEIVLNKKGAAPETLPSVVYAGNGYALKLIRPKSFTMGSSRREQGRRSNETLRKTALKRPVYMGTREITNKAFREYLSSHTSGAFKTQTLNLDDQPVVRVTWKQAALFCNWLSEKEGLLPVYLVKGDRVAATDPMSAGYRLPTEAEWEYCARFVDTEILSKYPWGDRFPPPNKSVNIADISAKELLPATLDAYEDGYSVSAPTGAFAANKLGLHDLGGNVAEWCHDYYTIYPYSAQKVYSDPNGPKEGKHRVVRGSSWRHASISALRSAYRDYSNSKRPDLGFRICRYAK